MTNQFQEVSSVVVELALAVEKLNARKKVTLNIDLVFIVDLKITLQGNVPTGFS